MKRSVILTCIILSFGIVRAQYNADDIIGYYHLVDPFTDEESQIYISKTSSGKYEGTITWVGNPAKKGFLGLIFLKDMEWNAKKQEWENAVIKYPGKKGDFSAYMYFQDANTLKVRGYWGISMLGKTVYWKKEKAKRVQKAE